MKSEKPSRWTFFFGGIAVGLLLSLGISHTTIFHEVSKMPAPEPSQLTDVQEEDTSKLPAPFTLIGTALSEEMFSEGCVPHVGIIYDGTYQPELFRRELEAFIANAKGNTLEIDVSETLPANQIYFSQTCWGSCLVAYPLPEQKKHVTVLVEKKGREYVYSKPEP